MAKSEDYGRTFTVVAHRWDSDEVSLSDVTLSPTHSPTTAPSSSPTMVPCASGKFSATPGLDCTDCAVGRWSGEGAPFCTDCAAGRYYNTAELGCAPVGSGG